MAVSVLLVISSLGPGGAERQLSGIANYWASRGWQVTLVTLSKTANEPFYALHPAVERYDLKVIGRGASFYSILPESLRALHILRAQIKQLRPRVVISFIDQCNILVLLAAFGIRIPVIVSERTDPRHHRIASRWNLLRYLVYPLAARIVVQCEDYKRGLSLMVRRRCAVVPNFVRPRLEPAACSVPVTGRHKIIAMGRLSWEKGFDLLIRAFAKIAHEFEDWTLDIWGEGPMRQELEQLALRVSLGRQVRFCGLTRRPEEQFAQAELFVLSSRYEGFPNALLEAMAAGLPVISFACPAGPAAIIRHGIDGLLVPPENVAALAEALRSLLVNQVLRQKMAARATEVLDRFSQETVMTQWENLILSNQRIEASGQR